MSSLLRAIIAWALALGLSGPALAGDAPLFRFADRDYAAPDLSPKLRRLLHELELEHYRERARLVDEMLYEVHLDREAQARGVDRRALAAELLQVPAPSEAEVKDFYQAHRHRIGQPYEAVRDQVVRHLRAERLREEKTRLLARIKAEGGFELLARAPEPPPYEIDVRGYPSRGPEDAPITVIEFADYQCPHCRRAAGVMQRLLAAYPEDLRHVYLDFPVNRSGISRSVAIGAVCADAQGRYWEYHDRAFAGQRSLGHHSPLALAESLSLDLSAFERCLGEDAARGRVAYSERQARALGLTATPSIFVNGRPLPSGHLERDLTRLIEQSRAARGD